jgi:hypothetical protein
LAQLYTQMIDELQATLLIQLCKQCHLRISRAAPDERAAGVIANAAYDRCANA